QYDEVADLIVQKDLSRSVFMHGSVPYSKFGDVLSDALLFVGMGTAVLEASACGVPSLVAIESCDEPLTYGFLPDTRGHNAGEYSPDAEKYAAIEKIEALAALGPEAYQTHCTAAAKSAEKFSIETVADEFVGAL